MYDPRPFSKRIYLDACLTGLGGTFDNFVYTLPLPPEYCTFNIAHLEMLNVVYAFKVWGHLWADHRIKINYDNMAVVVVLQSGYARDTFWLHVLGIYGCLWPCLTFQWFLFIFQVHIIMLLIYFLGGSILHKIMTNF